MNQQEHAFVSSAVAFGLGYLIGKDGMTGTAQNWLAKALVILDPSCTHAQDVIKANAQPQMIPATSDLNKGDSNG